MRLRARRAPDRARPADPRHPPEALVAGARWSAPTCSPARDPVGAPAARGAAGRSARAQPRLAPPARRARRARDRRSRPSRAGRVDRASPRSGAGRVSSDPASTPCCAAAAGSRSRLAGVAAARPPPPGRGRRGRSPAASPHARGRRAAVSERPLRLGLIGCGRLAERRLRAGDRRARRASTLVAVADPESRAARAGRAAARRRRPRVRTTAAEVLARGGGRRRGDRQPAGRARRGRPSLPPRPGSPAWSRSRRRRPRRRRARWRGSTRRRGSASTVASSTGERAAPPDPAREDRSSSSSSSATGVRRGGRVSVGDDALLDLAPHLVDLALLLTGVGGRLRVRAARLDAGARRARARDRARAGADPLRDRPRPPRAGRGPRATGVGVARSVAGGPVARVAGRLPGREHPLVALAAGAARARSRPRRAAAIPGRSRPRPTGRRVMG